MDVLLLQRKLTQLPRRTKRIVMVAADSVMMPLALYCAAFLKFESLAFTEHVPLWMFPVAPLLSIPIFARLGLYRAVVRFMGSRMVYAVLQGVSLSVALLLVIGLVVGSGVATVSVLAIYWVLALFYVGGSRFVVRSLLQRRSTAVDRVAIYGAGEAGARLAITLAGGQEFVPVAFVDDNVTTQRSVINGLEVYSPHQLPGLIKDLEISRILLALPTTSRRRRRRILENLEPLSVHVQTMPNFSDLISGRARVDEIKDVDVADLLGRDSVPPIESLLDACIRGKSVMVTGAGGSIGSELCRQILQSRPTRLLLFELSELALYNIEREIRQMASHDELDVEIIALLGSVQQKDRVREIFETFGVHTVYHAAAYKHVPLVEHNMIEGVNNNVMGTWRTAEAAIQANVETFVLVSTDKAVCPTNVMGATKRFAELVLQGITERGSRTRFCMVRFGNVLASSGSVVPLFREQIRKGGPVTVTHPEIIRYFMTIPEAAQLVIQAGSMGQGGDVFVLDMGKPVRIADLAKRMIHLMGFQPFDEDNPDGDIEIKYTGLRPAEKLYEELLIGNNVMGTEHPMILRAEEDALPWQDVQSYLGFLSKTQFDCQKARQVLLKAVAGYSPAGDVADVVWRRRSSNAQARPSKVADIRRHRAKPIPGP